MDKLNRFYRQFKPQRDTQINSFQFLNGEKNGRADLKEQKEMKNLFASIGADPWIDTDLYCINGKNIYAGDNLVIDSGCSLNAEEQISFGNKCYLAPNVKIYSGSNDKESDGSVILGSNVWIGTNSVILPGVELGDDVVVCSNSVVGRSYEDNAIIAGDPARIISEGKPAICQNDSIFKENFFAKK